MLYLLLLKKARLPELGVLASAIQGDDFEKDFDIRLNYELADWPDFLHFLQTIEITPYKLQYNEALFFGMVDYIQQEIIDHSLQATNKGIFPIIFAKKPKDVARALRHKSPTVRHLITHEAGVFIIKELFNDKKKKKKTHAFVFSNYDSVSLTHGGNIVMMKFVSHTQTIEEVCFIFMEGRKACEEFTNKL